MLSYKIFPRIDRGLVLHDLALTLHKLSGHGKPALRLFLLMK